MVSARSGFIVALLAAAASAAPAPPQQPMTSAGRYVRQSFGSGVGPLSASVIGSWQFHGAHDFVIENVSPSFRLPAGRPAPEWVPPRAGGPAVPPPPGAVVDVPMDDWIVDFVVLWRWRGRTVSLEQGSVGQEPLQAASLHRVVAGGRDLSVRFDPELRTAQIADGPLVTLRDHNVLMLDVEERGVRVAETLKVDLRLPSRPAGDPASALLAQSRAVEAFVTSR